jgi:hypothetical protein
MAAAGAQYEEWRLSFELPKAGPKAVKFIESLRARLPPNVHVHESRRNGVRVYAGSRPEIDRALKLIGEQLAAHGTQAQILLSRWNPGAERWQAPELPVEPPRPADPDPWAGLDETAWEVRLRFDRHADADRLVRRLQDDGAAVLGGWRRCLVPLADEATARQRAGELRLSAPFAEIDVRPISRFRRWMIRQQVYGNYAAGGGGNGGGEGGGC